MSRKLLSWILILSMIFSLCSVPAFAEAENGEDEEIENVLSEDEKDSIDAEEGENVSPDDDQSSSEGVTSDTGDCSGDGNVPDDGDFFSDGDPAGENDDPDAPPSTNEPQTNDEDDLELTQDPELADESDPFGEGSPEDTSVEMRGAGLDSLSDNEEDGSEEDGLPDRSTYSGTCGAQGDNVTWTLYDDGELVIEGTGDMASYTDSFNAAPWSNYYTGITSLVIENGVTNIGERTFFGCSYLVNVIIPTTVTSIGANAFTACSALTSISIPESVESIGITAFSSCSMLKSIDLPESLITISDRAFEGCGAIETVVYAGTVEQRNEREGFGWRPIGNSYLFNATWTYLKIAVNSITLNKSSTEICIGATELLIPTIRPFEATDKTLVWTSSDETVATVDENGLVTGIATGNTTITVTTNDGSFTATCDVSVVRAIIDSGNCGADGDNLNWNLYDNGLLEITGSGDMADFRDASDAPWYSYRESICTVVIAEGATSIGRCAFDRYVVLTEVSLPAGLTLIGEDAFCGCSSLTEISLPSSVTTLSMYAFAECTALTEIVIPSGVSAIPLAAFASCTSLVSVTLPSSVRSIGRFAFSGCEKLSDAVLPEGVTSIADSAFRLCSSLSDFSLPQSLTFIGPGAFHGCSMPNSLVLPGQLTSIGDYAFSYCTGVESVSIPSSVAELGISVFSCCSALRTITVDGNNTAYSSADGVLFDKECRTLLCYPAGGATSYQIPSTVTRLGLSCFSGCRNLSEISIPDSVVSIGGDAFWLCPFETVIIPASVTSIESRAFYACELSSILFMGGPPAIEADAFENDSANAIYYSDKGWTAADFGNYGGTLNWIEIVEGEPTLLSWEWTDFTAAKARILGSDDGLVHTLDAVVAETRVEPGCETEGSVLHTATVTFEETSFSDVKTESIPALGHQWDSGVVITIGSRPEDGEILYTCLRDSSHTKTVTVEKDSQGDYIFSSFEQLKLLARYAYDEERWTSARCSSDDLMIRESLTMPDGLGIYFSNLNVPLGVIFTVNGSISGHSMIVDGTMYLGDNRFGVGDFVNHVTVNGHLTLDMWLWVTEITGRQNITYEDNGRIAYQPYVSTEEELRLAIDAALQAPEHTSYSIYVQNPLTLEQDLTIPVTGFNEKIRTISFNGLTIPAGVTLTNNGYLDFYQMPQIDGTLVNNGWLEVYTSVHSEQTLRDFLAHEWTNVVAGERSFTQQIVSVYGEISLTEDLEILPTQRVDLDDSCLFSIPEGRTLTVNGDLLQHSGEILLDGTLRVNGFAEQYPYGQEVPVIRISDTGCLEGSGTLTIANGLDPAVTLIGYSGPEPIRVDNDYNDYWIIYLSDGWSVINGERYYKLHGSWVTGWKQIDGEWYFFQSSGAAATGWQKIGNVWYYFLSNGTMATGMQVIGGKTYGFADNGRMLTGWQQIDDAWYYFQSSGAAATGWQKIGNVWYYFLFDGAMATGMQVIGGKTYGFADNGRMFTGWKQIDGNWYYFLDNGAASTGWKQVSSKWYYFDAEGVMQTGFQQIDGRTYFFNDNGSMFTGWKEIGGVWYYFLDNGAAATGWKQVGSKWYYFGEDGAMYTGLQMIGEKKYFFLDNGSMVTGWKQIDGTWYYFLDNGAACIGWKKLGSSWYYFDSDGSMLANTSRTIGSKVYYFAENGVCMNP